MTFDTNTQTMVGSDLVLTALVKNVSKDDKDVEMVLAARTCRYWNHSSDDKHLAKEKFAERTIKPGESNPDTPLLDFSRSCCPCLRWQGAKCEKTHTDPHRFLFPVVQQAG